MHPKIRDEAQTYIMNACIKDLHEDIIVKTSNCQKEKHVEYVHWGLWWSHTTFLKLHKQTNRIPQETIVIVCNSSIILCHLCWLGDLPCLVILGGKCSYDPFNHTTGSLSHFTIYTHLKFNRNPVLLPLDPNNPWKNEGFTAPQYGLVITITPKNEGNVGSHCLLTSLKTHLAALLAATGSASRCNKTHVARMWGGISHYKHIIATIFLGEPERTMGTSHGKNQWIFCWEPGNLSSRSWGIDHPRSMSILFILATSHAANSTYGGFLKWWYPTTMGFTTKNDHFGVEIGGTTI